MKPSKKGGLQFPREAPPRVRASDSEVQEREQHPAILAGRVVATTPTRSNGTLQAACPAVLNIRARCTLRRMLHARTVLSRDGLTVADVACRHDLGHGQPAEYTGGHTLVFVRRGWFRRSANGVERCSTRWSPTASIPARRSATTTRTADGDDCTALGLDPTLVASLLGGEPTLPTGVLPTTRRVDLEHGSLLAEARGSDPDELFERAIELAACALEQLDPRRVAAGRPATARARRMLANGAREALAADPLRSLPAWRARSASPRTTSAAFSIRSPDTPSPAIASGCAREPPSTASPTESPTSHASPPNSASQTRATSAARSVARPDRPRPSSAASCHEAR